MENMKAIFGIPITQAQAIARILDDDHFGLGMDVNWFGRVDSTKLALVVTGIQGEGGALRAGIR
jgi:hypothetical protein